MKTRLLTVRITNIDGWEECRARMGEPRIRELAESIRDNGMLHPPTVTHGLALVAGRDRIAAALVLDWTELPCMVLSSDPPAEVLERITLTENIHRRSDLAERQRDIARYVELGAAALRAAINHVEAPGAGVREVLSATEAQYIAPASVAAVKTAAVREAAAALGISERTAWRAVAAEEARKNPPPADPVRRPLDPSFRHFGLELDEHKHENFRAAIAATRAVLRACEGVAASIEALVATAPTLGVARLESSLRRLAEEVAGTQAWGVCPWCKTAGNLVGGCVGCHGSGWVTVARAMESPAELRAPGSRLIWRRGRIEEG